MGSDDRQQWQAAMAERKQNGGEGTMTKVNRKNEIMSSRQILGELPNRPNLPSLPSPSSYPRRSPPPVGGD